MRLFLKELFQSNNIIFDLRIKLVGIGLFSFLLSLVIIAPVYNIDFLYFFFKNVCHQDPKRSFFLSELPLAVCIRCSAIYFGSLIGFAFIKKSNERLAIFLLLLTFILNLLQFIIELWLSSPEYYNMNVSFRTACGLFLGYSISHFLLLAFTDLNILSIRS